MRVTWPERPRRWARRASAAAAPPTCAGEPRAPAAQSLWRRRREPRRAVPQAWTRGRCAACARGARALGACASTPAARGVQRPRRRRAIARSEAILHARFWRLAPRAPASSSRHGATTGGGALHSPPPRALPLRQRANTWLAASGLARARWRLQLDVRLLCLRRSASI